MAALNEPVGGRGRFPFTLTGLICDEERRALRKDSAWVKHKPAGEQKLTLPRDLQPYWPRAFLP